MIKRLLINSITSCSKNRTIQFYITQRKTVSIKEKYHLTKFFYLSFKAETLCTAADSAVQHQCPGSTPPQIASFAVETINRYCGQRLNCVSGSVENSWIYSDVLPFEIGVELNGAEPSTGPAPDNKNRGFSLDYLQQPC